jgi:hypothetical protein
VLAREHEPWLGGRGQYTPTLYDIESSAHWANKSDNDLIIHRDRDKNVTRPIVQKFLTFPEAAANCRRRYSKVVTYQLDL